MAMSSGTNNQERLVKKVVERGDDVPSAELAILLPEAQPGPSG
jgi:hypothetical protein